MKRLVQRVILVAAAACAAAGAGCNTLEGLGKDLERGGAAMQAFAR